MINDLSQNGEAKILENIITSDFPNIIVDVGAHDGITFSNSYNFINKGWNAICIEANPFIYKKLKSNLKNFELVKTLNLACSNYNGKSELFIGQDGDKGLLSTLCKDNNSWFNYARSNKKILVPVSTLEKVLDRNNIPSDFSILLVDTEGMDFEVLKGLNFKKYSPRIIVTEEYKHNIKKHNKKYQLLKSNNYKLKHKLRCNTIWVRKDLTNSEDLFSHSLSIEKSVKNYLKNHSGVSLNFKNAKKEFNLNKYDVELIKNPKWEDDALIFRVKPNNVDLTYDLVIKLHEDKYPLANHIYNNQDILTKIGLSGKATNIIKTNEMQATNNIYRYVMYDYISGITLGKLVKKVDTKEISKLRNSLKDCVNSLLDIGINVFVRDLDDFIVYKNNSNYTTCLTDYNAIMDCSNASKYSREKIKGIVGNIIDNLVDKDYVPFVSQRPTLIDLKEKKNDLRF